MQPLPFKQPKEGYMKLSATVLLAAALLASAGAAQAQFRTPQDAIDYRMIMRAHRAVRHTESIIQEVLSI